MFCPPPRPKARTYSDFAVPLFLENLPATLTFTEMAAACLEQFGRPRAWSRSKIVRYWEWRFPKGRAKMSRAEADLEVREFIEERVGRMTLTQLLAACRAAFAFERCPGRTALARHIIKVKRARRK